MIDFWGDIHKIATGVQSIAQSLETIVKIFNTVTGFAVEPKNQRSATMAKFTCKAKKGQKAARKFKAGDVINPNNPFAITDDPNNPGHWKVLLTNAAGELIDGSAIATFAGVADASGNLTETDEPPMGFATQGNHAGPATVSGTVTANDGSFGPFTGDIAFDVQPGGPTGFVVMPA